MHFYRGTNSKPCKNALSIFYIAVFVKNLSLVFFNLKQIYILL